MPHPDQSELAHCFADTIKAIPQCYVLMVLCSLFQGINTSGHCPHISAPNKVIAAIQKSLAK
jgi:pimeloyl-ACP methyl ester carboxylesterase